MHEWAHFFERLIEYLGTVWDISYVPTWNFIKSFACAWIAGSIMRFKPDENTQFKFRVTVSATALFVLCIMELARVVTGVSTGVSPFVSLILLMLAYRLHIAKGNVSQLKAA